MLPTHPNHVWTPQLSQALLVSLCSKAHSSSATKGLICHPDHLRRQQCHCQVSLWLSPSPGCGEGLCLAGEAKHPWASTGQCHHPSEGSVTPCTATGCRFGSWKGDVEAGHHLLVPGHSTHQPTHMLPTHAGPHPLTPWGSPTRMCVHTRHTYTHNRTCKHTPLCPQTWCAPPWCTPPCTGTRRWVHRQAHSCTGRRGVSAGLSRTPGPTRGLRV